MRMERCEGKVRYACKKDAVTMMNARMRGGRRGRGRNRCSPSFLRTYHCEQCNGWHLTKGKQHRHK